MVWKADIFFFFFAECIDMPLLATFGGAGLNMALTQSILKCLNKRFVTRAKCCQELRATVRAYPIRLKDPHFCRSAHSFPTTCSHPWGAQSISSFYCAPKGAAYALPCTLPAHFCEVCIDAGFSGGGSAPRTLPGEIAHNALLFVM